MIMSGYESRFCDVSRKSKVTAEMSLSSLAECPMQTRGPATDCISMQNGKSSYLYSVLAKRPNYKVLQSAKCQNVSKC